MDNDSNVIHENNETTKKTQVFAPKDLLFLHDYVHCHILFFSKQHAKKKGIIIYIYIYNSLKM
jgi:hypothetical protein